MKRASILMIIGSLLLLGLFPFALWNITLIAPQYPDSLGIDIFITGLRGVEEFDLQNIDGLNHYIGMKTLPRSGEMWEFEVFPIVIIAMSALGVLLGILGFARKIKPIWFLVWFILMTILGILGMYDFNLWLTDYGSNLDPKAIIKVVNPDGTPMTYSPPLIGTKKLLNFDVASWPRLGAYFLFLGMLLNLLAYYLGNKALKTSSK